MPIRYLTLTALTALIACPAMGLADPGENWRVPRGHLPPPGECRVWYPGVSPGQQPPPTDCRSARRQARYQGARVVYGGREGRDDYRRYSDRDDDRDYGRGRYRDRSERRDYQCDEKDWRKGEC